MSKITKIPATDSTFGHFKGQLRCTFLWHWVPSRSSTPSRLVRSEERAWNWMHACWQRSLAVRSLLGIMQTSKRILTTHNLKQVVCDANKWAAYQRMVKALLWIWHPGISWGYGKIHLPCDRGKTQTSTCQPIRQSMSNPQLSYHFCSFFGNAWRYEHASN